MRVTRGVELRIQTVYTLPAGLVRHQSDDSRSEQRRISHHTLACVIAFLDKDGLQPA